MEFYSERLEEPKLKFGRDTTDIHLYTIKSLNAGGPYDVGFIGSKRNFNALLLYPKSEQYLANQFILKLREGTGQFKGFYNVFRKSLHINRMPIEYTTRERFEKTINDMLEAPGVKDIVFLLLPRGIEEVYYFMGKLIFSSQGIPSQFISAVRIEENIKRGTVDFYLQNISLAVYCKLGGKPWVLHRSEDMGSDLILGVGGTRFEGRNYFAFTTLFERDGAFDWWSADTPGNPSNETEYVTLLKNQIINAIRQYKTENPDFSVERVSFHISGKRPGKLEVQAITEAMSESQQKFKYTIFHINTTSPLWIADYENSRKFFHPPQGLKVKLSSKDFLLVVDQPGRNPRAPLRPTRITLIKHNFKNEEFKNIHVMVKEIYGLTRMNWKGFRVKKIPVSVYYPKTIARFLEKFKVYDNQGYLSYLKSNSSLKRKAWFL